ncbi:Ankyrin repeat-containing domain protein [Lactarius tabidus]
MSHDPDDPSVSTSSPNFDTIFADALKQYKKRTKKVIAGHSLAAQIESCDSPSTVLTALQTQVQTFDPSLDPSPSANERWTTLLGPTITVLYAFSGFVSNMAGPAFPPAAAIFTGIGVLLQIVKGVRATEDILIDLFGRMKFVLMRLEKYIAVRPTAAMTDIIVQIMVEIISILGIATKEIEQGRLNKYAKKLFGIHRVEDAFRRLDKLTQEGARMAEVEIAAHIDGGIQVVSEHVSDLNRHESRMDLRQWIDAPDRCSNFYAASDAHREGTAAWCIEGETFADWMVSGSLLWIHGKPGSGKTILSSVIIRDIESMRNAGLAFLAYFYFDFKDEGKKDSRALLSSLLDQLSDQSDPLRDVLRGLYSEHEDGSKQPPNDALVRCLKDMLTIAGSAPAYLVMDALDECPNDLGDLSSFSPRGKVLSLVKELVGLRLPNLRLCITSRPELDIRAIIKPLSTQEISLPDESGQKRDINAYIAFVVQSVKHWRDDDKQMVIDKLTEDADGMFRWVYCKLEVLRQCHRNDLRRILKELPPSLDDAYQRILKEINNADRKDAHRLFQYLAVAQRPLRVEELAAVLALDVDAGGIPKFNASWRRDDLEATVLSACSSLVSVVNHDGSQVVQFCHLSVKEFLMSDRLGSTEDISQFHISHDSSHVILAQACLGVLLSVDHPTPEDSAGDIPLSGYAYEHWLGHAKVGNVELQIKDALDRFFDLDRPHFAAFFRSSRSPFKLRFFKASSDEESKGVPVLSPAVPFYFAAISGLSGLAERLIVAKKPQVIDFCGYKGTLLHLAASEGHINAVRQLLTHGADINSHKDFATPPHNASLIRRENRLTPLHLAASEGHLDICQMLLERDADVRVHDDGRDTPLHLAASSHHLEITRILLKYNAEVNSRNEVGSTPLLIASSTGNLDILRLLLAHNADASVRDNRGRTPLHLATIRGHIEVARCLLELKADINVLDNRGLTPLHQASQGRQRGDPDIVQLVRLLLDNGADLHARDNRGNTPLHFAAPRGHLEITRMLLELKADVNSQDDEGSTPLQRASQVQRERKSDIMRLLLDYGANVNVYDKCRNTLLHFAASEGHIEVARMLLERGADVNFKNDEGLAPLQRASQVPQEGKSVVMRLLLDYGANADLYDKRRNTPLHFAASEGHLEVARMLLERGADVNSKNDEGLTPLQRASQIQQEGKSDIMRLLLDYGANANVYDKRRNTPLHFAASEGHLEVVRMLLELGADVNSKNEKGLTPLLQALQGRREGHRDIIQLLLDHGANVNMHDKRRNTPLHFAASEGHFEVARILLEHGADVNSQNDEGLTPLQQASQGQHLEYREVIRLLLDCDANVNMRDNNGNTTLHFAASEGHLEVARMLLERGADVNSQNDEGLTPLRRASQVQREGKSDIMQLLLDHGADANLYDKRGNTPLHFAASEGHLEAARMLLRLEADVDSLNDKGLTPLQQASQGQRRGHRDVVRLLLGHGAIVNLYDIRRNTALHFTASEGHLEVARMLLERGADVNSQNDEGLTPLQRASQVRREGQQDIMRLLLDHGANVDMHDNSGNTVLHFAASEGHPDIMQLLLDCDANVNMRDNSGNTALHFAASKGHFEVIRMLLERGADVNSLNDMGLTPFHRASQVQREGQQRIMCLLLDHGANVNMHDSRRNTALHFTASEGHLEVARMLLRLKADVNSQNDEGLTPLQRASQVRREGQQDIMRLLLDHGANVDMRDNSGNTALHFAVSEGHPDIMRLLLDCDANVNMRDISGNTALHVAASEGHLEVARILLKLGANVNSQNDMGLTPLQRASQGWRKGQRDIIRLLLDHGANLNTYNKYRNTPLHFAASEGHLEAARFLLELGTDVNSQNDKGLTPLHRASQVQREGKSDIVRLLLDHGANVNVYDKRKNTPLHFAASEGHLEVARMLLELGADINSLNDEGLTPFQRASQVPQEGKSDIMRLLLDHGANVNVYDKRRNIALHFAVSKGHLEVARMLLELGADVNSQNDKGLTPLLQALQGRREGHRDIIQLLLDHGANVNMHDKRRNTPLHFAASEGHLEVARIILELGADVNSQNDEGLTPLQRASQVQQEGKKLDIMRLLLDYGANVNIHDNGNTVLHFAVSDGLLEVARMLLEHNAEVDSQNSHGSTPLLLASELGSPDLVQLFLDHNADVHVCDAYGDTLLHCAAIAGRLEISRLLLKLDVEVNSRNNEGSTPLHLASAGYEAGNPDIVRLFLEHGADAQARNLSGKTASEVARGRNRQEIVQLLSQHAAG